MNYLLTVVKQEPNPEYEAWLKGKSTVYGGYSSAPPVTVQHRKMEVALTEEEYRYVRNAVISNWEDK